LGAICPNVVPGGCVRYVTGFDVTGVTNLVTLGVAQGILTSCDCINACLQNFETCDAFVWKFTDNGRFRTCTLYSNFNLPPAVTLGFANNSTGFGVLGQNPQTGGLVTHCTLNGSPNAPIDPNCVSGGLWALDTGAFIC